MTFVSKHLQSDAAPINCGAVLSAFLVVLSAADATARSAAPLTLSPRAVAFGTSMHVGQLRTVKVTVLNKSSYSRLLRGASIRNKARGCRAFGTKCPLRIVSRLGACTSNGSLGPGQHCTVTLAFRPLAPGRLAVSLCTDSLGPLGTIQPPAMARSCVSVKARVLATSSAANPGNSPTTRKGPVPFKRGSTQPPANTSPTKPGATKPPSTTPPAKPANTKPPSTTSTTKPTPTSPTTPTHPTEPARCVLSSRYQQPPSLTTSASFLITPSSFDFGSLPQNSCVYTYFYVITGALGGIDFSTDSLAGPFCTGCDPPILARVPQHPDILCLRPHNPSVPGHPPLPRTNGLQDPRVLQPRPPSHGGPSRTKRFFLLLHLRRRSAAAHRASGL